MKQYDDAFQKWRKEETLNAKLVYLRGAASNFYSQKKMASDLGITEQTFITLKRKHKEIRDALALGDEQLKTDILSALKKRAVGFTSSVKIKSMEKDGTGRQKQKIEEVEKIFPPNVDAIKYILSMKFGREYHPKKEELNIMEKKSKPEEWLLDDNK